MCLPNSGSPWSFLVPDSCPSLLSWATGPLPGVICGSVVCHPVRRGSAEWLAGCVRGAGSSGSLFRDLCGCCGVWMGTGAGLPGGGKVCRGLCPVPAGSARVSAGICAGHWQGLRGSVQVCAGQWRGCVRGSVHRTRPWCPLRRALRQRGIFCRGSVSHLCLPMRYQHLRGRPAFWCGWCFPYWFRERLVYWGSWPASFLCPRRRSVVSHLLACLCTSTYSVLPAGFSHFGQMYVIFLSWFCVWASLVGPSRCHPPFFVWGSHTPAHCPLPP